MLLNDKRLAKYDVSNRMIFIKGGSFQVVSNDGSSDEKPVPSMSVSDFFIDKYEVMVKEYREFCDAIGTSLPFYAPDWGWQDDHPIVNVSRDDATAYAKWAVKRLHTEAEWEYAARCGIFSKGYKYSGSSNLDEVGWYESNSGGKTRQIGQKKPNELGIYDMSGNVSELCQDFYNESYYAISPSFYPNGPYSDREHVVRGGS